MHIHIAIEARCENDPLHAGEAATDIYTDNLDPASPEWHRLLAAILRSAINLYHWNKAEAELDAEDHATTDLLGAARAEAR